MNSFPLISICVPTYNRAKWLVNIIEDLLLALERFEEQIEVCVSDNCSIDHTDKVLEKLKGKKYFKHQRQDSNLGAARNIAAVSFLASGRWILLVGDDDRLDLDSIAELLKLLITADDNEWLILNRLSGQFSSHSQLTHSSGGSLLSPFRSKTFAVLIGAKPISFMGTHLFPRCIVKDFENMVSGEMLVWPHLGGLYRFLGDSGRLRLFARPVVIQSAGQLALFWPVKEFVKIYFEIMRAIVYSMSKSERGFLFCWWMLVRQLYAPMGFGLLVAWKIQYEEDFMRKVGDVCSVVYENTQGKFLPIFPHRLAVYFIRCVPVKLIRFCLTQRFVSKIAELSKREEELGNELNGVERGL